MQQTKQILFSALSSLLVILGLGFLNIFGVTLIYTPILLAAALIGLLITILGGKNSPAYVLIAAFAGFAGAIVLRENVSAGTLTSPALMIAFSISLPAIMIWLRERIFKGQN